MKKLNKIYRIRLSDFELNILKVCREHKISPSNFVRKAIMEKAEIDLGIKVEVVF